MSKKSVTLLLILIVASCTAQFFGIKSYSQCGPPVVTIISPANTTYTTTSVPLNYTVNEPTGWVGYSLDGAANVTITGNTTLSGLSYAPHNVTVYANDTYGDWGKDTTHFTVEEDVTPPEVTIISPANTTYTTTSVPLTYKVDEKYPDWVGYSLDGAVNVTLTGNTTLSGLSLGSHDLTVYANDTSSNWGWSTVWFTVKDETPPVVTIISPTNTTYTTASVPLTYKVDEKYPDWVGYSLDGATNVTLTGNTTLSGLELGSYDLIIYANDTSGNWGNDTVGFTVDDITPPMVTIISPMNATYNTTVVSLEYKVDEDFPDWVGYSLDGAANVTLTGNTTLSGLSLGSHTLTVYANDTSGNWGNDTVGFTVAKPDSISPVVYILSPTNTTYTTTEVSLEYTVEEEYPDWVGYSLDGAANVTLTGNTTLSGLSLGSHTLTVYANDTSGNWGNDTVGFTVEDITPPIVTIISPDGEETYYSSSVPLTYRVDEDFPDWVGYSLDGATNITLTGNTTLSGLSLGSHTLTVYANDTSGNWGNDTVDFAVEDVTPPEVTIISPKSKTYTVASTPTSIPLTYKVDEEYPDWVGYSLDGAANVTLTGNTKLSGLSKGSHTLTVYANDTSGNKGQSSVSFTVRIQPPPPNWPPEPVTLHDPTDIASTSMSLSWTMNEDFDFKKYVLYHSTSEDSIDQKVTEITDRSDTSYQITGLSEETTYYYIVWVYDTANQASDSNIVSARTNSPPNAVTLHDPTDITNTSMSLSWTENEDSDFNKYVLFNSTSEDSIGQKVTETTNRSDTSYQMTGLSDNTTYYYVVRVYDTGALSSDSNQASARTNKTIPPDNEPPILVILSPANTTYDTSSVELTWLTNEPLEWAGFSLNGGATTTITGNQTISDLEEGPYNLVLHGTDLAGNEGSDTVSFTVVVPDTIPPEITHTPVTDGVEGDPIEVSAVITDESGVSEAELYYRKGGDTDYVLLGMSSAGADTYTATIPASFVDEETIEYYILASDGENEATHPSVAPTTSPHVIDVNLNPDPVALYVPASEAISTDTVELTWSESLEPDFRNYMVYMSGSEGVLGDVLKEVAERSETSHTVEELEPDTTYYFSVRAYDTGGLYADSNQLEVHTGVRRVVWTTNLFIFLLVLLPLGVGGAYYYFRNKRAGPTSGEILT